MRLRTSPLLVLALVVSVLGAPATPAAAAGALNGHAVVLDGNGRIIPWTTNPSDGYGTVIDAAWQYLLDDVPTDPANGKPAYYSHSYLNPDTQEIAGWPHNPAGLYGMLVESALKYYAYSGDIAPVQLAQQVAQWQLDHGRTKSTDNWALVPYSSGESGSLTYQGAGYGDQTGVGDGTGYLQPDKVGAMGLGWAQLYEFDGNTAFRDAAVAAADALASHVRTGSATQSPWPFRVNAATGAVREQYTANVIDPIQLFDTLIALGAGNTAAYRTARQTAWTWLMTYPMVNNNWSNYFEDVAVQSDLGNRNQLIPMMTARYLLLHPETDANWQTHVRGLIAWVDDNFGVDDTVGATIVREQNAFYYPMGSHTSRFASVNALLAAATGDTAAKTTAYYSLNWATYMARPNGVVIDGPQVNNQWFTDGYGDYIRHFLTSMQAFPEWAPNGQSHLTGSTTMVTAVGYPGNGLTYTTAQAPSTEVGRLAFVPTRVTVGGRELTRRDPASGEGWSYDAGTGVFRVRHDTGTAVVVTGSGGQVNAAPTASITSPAAGSTFAAGSDITVAATARDTDGSVASVQFKQGSQVLGTATTAPYQFTWKNVPAGSYDLTAVATDNAGATGSSAAVRVTVPAPSTLPSPWQSRDIGAVGVTGSTTYSGGTFTVRGSGVDIWGVADSFHYAYQPLAGDGSITARVATQQAGDPWSLAGVMIRGGLDASAPHAFAGVTPGNGLSFTTRSAADAASDYTDGGAGTAPVWVRLTRAGGQLTAERSANGTSWTQFGSATVDLGATVQVGLAVSSHDNASLAADTFTGVAVAGAGDRTPPVLSAVAAGSVNQNGAAISWTTDEPADSRVEYGTTASYGSSTALNSTPLTNHSMVVSGLDAGTTYHYRVVSRDAAGNVATSGDHTFSTPAPATTTPTEPPDTPAAGMFGAVTPARILDTRTGSGLSGPLPAYGTASLQISGRAGVPAGGVAAVALTVTVTQPAASGHVRIWASGATAPSTSNLNFTPGATAANTVIAPVGADGAVQIYNGSPGTVQVLADVAGYYAAGTPSSPGAYLSVAPARLLDTRIGLGAADGMAPNGTLKLQVTGRGGVPATGVSAVALTVTVTQPGAYGYLSAWPGTAAKPASSSLNFAPGQTVPNLVIVPVGTDGTVNLYNGSPAGMQVIADVSGYFVAGTPSAAGAFAALAPARILDTRTAFGAPGPVAGLGSTSVQVTGRGGVPAGGVRAVVLNVTATEPAAAGYLQAYPGGTAAPSASILNFLGGQTVPNLVIVPVGTDGSVALRNGAPGTVQLIADVYGYVLG